MSIPLFAAAPSHRATATAQYAPRRGRGRQVSVRVHLRPRPAARTVPGSHTGQLVGKGITEVVVWTDALTVR
ncbi:hypothetical protein [Streptomyces sp. NPDC005148]